MELGTANFYHEWRLLVSMGSISSSKKLNPITREQTRLLLKILIFNIRVLYLIYAN